MGILLCEQNFRDVWNRNESVRAEIGQILHTDTHTHTTAAKLVVRIYVTVVTSVLRTNTFVEAFNLLHKLKVLFLTHVA